MFTQALTPTQVSFLPGWNNQYNSKAAQIQRDPQLSKKYHPDMSKDMRSKDIFSAASEAYAILSDDRERRAYDRSLLAQQHRATPSYHPRAPPSRAPRASHAWEYSSRPRSSAQHRSSPPEWPSYPHQRKNPRSGQHYTPPDPSVLYHNVGTRRSRQKADEEERAMERVRRVSGLTRAMQVVGLIALSAIMFGGRDRQ